MKIKINNIATRETKSRRLSFYALVKKACTTYPAIINIIDAILIIKSEARL